ncbi:MAG: heavy metal-associated domain-containing protein [Chloroflexota bacterium]
MTDIRPPAETIRFPVAGMTCGACVNRITRAIRKLDGVTRVVVDLRRETATVTREPALVSNAALATTVADAGYEADLDLAVVVPPTAPAGIVSRLLRAVTDRAAPTRC